MSPELVSAVKERIDLNYTKDQIADELRQAGYDDASIDQVYDSVISDVSAQTPSAVPMNAAAVPTIGEMFSRAFGFARRRVDLMLLAALPTVLASSTVLGFGLGWFSGVQMIAVLVILGILILFAVQALLQLSFAHTALSEIRNAPVAFGSSWSWATAGIFGWLWITLITACVIFGATIFLIIPGLVAMIYTMFVVYCYIDEDKRGMAALQRSRELVTGNFWFVAGRFAAFILLMFGFGVIFGILMEIVGSVVDGVGMTAGFIGVLLEAVLTGFVTVFGLFYIVQLYEVLRVKAASNSVPPTSWYTIAGVIGALLLVFMFGSIGLGIGTMLSNPEFMEAAKQLESMDIETMDLDDMSAEDKAEFEAFFEEFEGQFDSY